MADFYKLDSSILHPGHFANMASYNAAVYAVGLCNRIGELSRTGKIIRDGDTVDTPVFELTVNDTTAYLRRRISPTVTELIFGGEFNSEGRSRLTKQGVKEYFSVYRAVKRKHLLRIE